MKQLCFGWTCRESLTQPSETKKEGTNTRSRLLLDWRQNEPFYGETWAVSRHQRVAAGRSRTDGVHTLTRLDISSTESNWAGWRPAGEPVPIPPRRRTRHSWLASRCSRSRSERLYILAVYFIFCLLCQFAATNTSFAFGVLWNMVWMTESKMIFFFFYF